MKVSVVIPTRNRIKSLKECIKSLANQTYPIYELIVVDASDDNETEKYIKSLKINTHYIKARKVGKTYQRNAGLERAKGDIVLFLDDDVLLDERFIEEMVNTFINDEKEEIGGVGGKAKEEQSRIGRIMGCFYPLWGLIFLRWHWKKGKVLVSGHHVELPDTFSYTEWLDGKSMAFRKTILDKFNFKFDENIDNIFHYAYYEDIDFSYRISKKCKLLVNPKMQLIHKRASATRPNRFKFNSIKIQIHYYIVLKHNFNKIAFWWSTFGLLLAHAILLLLKPSKVKLHELRGLIEGIKKITKGEEIICGK